MLAAFEEFRGKLDPPSGALRETLADVRVAASEGGAFLGFLDGEPVASGRYALKEDHLYCGRLAVLPAFRGKGIGKALLAHVEKVAREKGFQEIRLATREVMESNLRLYLSQGYEVQEVFTHPAGTGRVVSMGKRLASS